MRILVYTPEHLFRHQGEQRLGDMRAGFAAQGIPNVTFISARADVGIQTWDDLSTVLSSDSHYWDSILVPVNVMATDGRTKAEIDTDVRALAYTARFMDRQNVVVDLATGAHERTIAAKMSLLAAGVIFIHENDEHSQLLHQLCIAAAGMPPLKTVKPTKVGPLLIDHMRQHVEIDGKTVGLDSSEYKILSHLARHQGVPQARETLWLRLDGDVRELTTNLVDVQIYEIRKKIDEAAGCDISRSLLKTQNGAGYLLVNDDAFMGLDVNTVARQQNFNLTWFTLTQFPDGQGRIDGKGPVLNHREVKLLRHLAANQTIFQSHKEIGQTLFSDTARGDIRSTRTLHSLRKKLAQVDKDFAACLSETIGGAVMFIPYGSTLESIEKMQRHKRTKDFGWFQLELSKSFDFKKQAVAGRVVDSDVTLTPVQTEALLFAHKHHNRWLCGTSDDKAVVPPYRFRFHLNDALEQLRGAGIDTTRFIKTYQRHHIKFMQPGDVDDGIKPAKPFLKPKMEPQGRVAIGDWFELDMAGGNGAIVGTGTYLTPALITVFNHAVANPETILTADHAPRLFPKSKNPEKAFISALSMLRKRLRAAGYADALPGVPQLGTFFCSKARAGQIVEIKQALWREKRARDVVVVPIKLAA